MPKQNVLFISLFYAPNAVVGAKRVFFLKRHLNASCHEAFVLMVKKNIASSTMRVCAMTTMSFV